jgi:hypothetical protein
LSHLKESDPLLNPAILRAGRLLEPTIACNIIENPSAVSLYFLSIPNRYVTWLSPECMLPCLRYDHQHHHSKSGGKFYIHWLILNSFVKVRGRIPGEPMIEVPI